MSSFPVPFCRGAAVLVGSLLGLLLALPIFAIPPETTFEEEPGLSFWAVEPRDETTLMSQEGCFVRLTPEPSGESEPTRRPQEQIHPCGELLHLAPGRYRYFLESPEGMSPATYVVLVAPGVDVSRRIEKPLVPAGRVALSPDARPARNDRLHLLHLDGHTWGEQPEAVLLRRAGLRSGVRQGVAMPPGKVVAALYDPSARAYRALSLPVHVVSGARTYVRPEPPEGGTADLLVELERPKPLQRFEDDDVDVWLLGFHEHRVPDVLIRDRERLLAIWYGLSEPVVLLEVASPTVELGSQEISLRRGRVASVEGTLRPRPEE